MAKVRELVNIHVYPSTGGHESRIKRSMRAAKNSGVFSEVCFLAAGNPDSSIESSYQEFGGGVYSVTGNQNSKLGYMLGILRFLLAGRKSCVVNVHNWYCLAPVVIAKVFMRLKIVYEPHEVEFGTSYATGRVRQLCITKLEYLCLKFWIDSVIFVGKAVQKEYSNKYGSIPAIQDSLIVYSLPNVVPQTKKDQEIGDAGVYVGMFTYGRGVELLIDAYKSSGDKLVLVGHGEMEDELRSKSAGSDNIEFVSSLGEKDLVDLLATRAKVAFSLMDTSSLSNRCASPNKFFAYCFANVPVVVSAYGDQATLTKEYSLGACIAENTVESLEVAIKEAVSIPRKNMRFEQFVNDFRFAKQQATLEEMYAEVSR